jgi:hypothetical protein
MLDWNGGGTKPRSTRRGARAIPGCGSCPAPAAHDSIYRRWCRRPPSIWRKGCSVATGDEQLRRAVFVAAAQVLGAEPLSAAQREALGDLGTLSWQLERSAPAAQGARAALSLRALSARLGPALQPKLAPLLVWTAIAGRAKSASPLAEFRRQYPRLEHRAPRGSGQASR